MKNVLIILISTLLCCVNNKTIETQQWKITSTGVGVFKMNTSVSLISVDSFMKITDTSYNDEEYISYGKCYYINKDEFYTIWYSENENNEIYEIEIKAKNAKTSDGIMIGTSIDNLFSDGIKNYHVFDDFGELVLVDMEQNIRFHFNGLKKLENSELNDLYKNTLSIDKKKCLKINVSQIDIFLSE
jgi:hypothetical protein